MNKRILKICLIIVVVFLIGCIGKTAIIKPELLPKPEYSFKSPASVSFHVGSEGQNFFKEGSWPGSAIKVSIDLKQTQEVVAKKVLATLYTNYFQSDLDNNNYLQDVNIIGTINNFNHSISNKWLTYITISFDMKLSAKDKQGNLIYTNLIVIKDYESSRGYFSPVNFLFLPPGYEVDQYGANKQSQLVGDTTTKKVYEIYIAEFEKIARLQKPESSAPTQHP